MVDGLPTNATTHSGEIHSFVKEVAAVGVAVYRVPQSLCLSVCGFRLPIQAGRITEMTQYGSGGSRAIAGVDPVREETASPPHQMENAMKKAIAASSGALATSLFVTPLDVAKVRLQSQLQMAPPVSSSTTGVHKVFPTSLLAERCVCGCHSRAPCQRSMPRAMWDASSRTTRWACVCISRSASSQAPMRLEGTSHALQHIFRTEGLTGLFAGLSPTLLIAIPSTVLYYVSYDMLLHLGRDRVPQWEPLLPLVAGSSARIFAASVTSPLELVRTRMQHDSGNRRIASVFAGVIRSGGYASLLNGLGATLARDVPFSAIYWTAFETTQKMAKSHSDLERGPRTFLCGAFAGALAATVTTPFDVAKTLLQVRSANESASIARVLRDITRTRGVSAAFTGLGARLARVAPSCAIMISCYDLSKQRLGIS